MTHVLKSPVAAIFILVALVFSACSKKPEEQILGKWQSERKSLEFFKDGSLVFNQGRENMMGTWVLPEPGTIRMNFKSQEGEFTEIADFTISGDEFRYKMKNSNQPEPNVMKRVKK